MRNAAKKVVSLCMAFVLTLGLVVVVMPTKVTAQQGWSWIVEPQFEQVYDFSEGLAAVRVDGLWGFIDTGGNMVIEPQFEWINSLGFRGSVAVVRRLRDDNHFFIDRTGSETEYTTNWNEIIMRIGYYGLTPFYIMGEAETEPDGSPDIMWGFRDGAGNIVIEPQFRISHDFSEGLAGVTLDWETYGFIDTAGNMVIEPQFEEVRLFSEGLAGFRFNQLWGFVDTTGNIVIEPQFESVGFFSDGLARASHGGREGFIDTSGNWVVEPQFLQVMPHYGGVAFVRSGWDAPWGLIAIGDAPATAQPEQATPTFTAPPTPIDNGIWMEFTVNTANRYGFRVFRATSTTGEGISISDFPITINPAHGLDRIITFDPNVRPNTQYWYYVREVLQEARFDAATTTLIPEVLGTPSARVSVTTSSDVPAVTAERGFIMMFIDNPYMNVNNVWEGIDPPSNNTAPVIQSGRTMVPIRAIIEAKGGTVAWNADDRRIDLRSHGNHVQMWLGQRDVRVNGARNEMDVTPEIVNGRTLIPLRFVAEFLGSQIEWIGSQRMIVIVYELQS